MCRRIMKKIRLPAGHEKVAIITFYRDQVALLRDKIPAQPGLRIDTVDAFQGKEADLVILSTVRTSTGRIGFLQDARRINVALTRAKLGLIVVGYKPLLEKDPLLNSWLQSIGTDDK